MNRSNPAPEQIHADSLAEQSLIGCCLIDRRAAVDVIGALKPSDWYFTPLRSLFEAIRYQVEEGLPFEPHSIFGTAVNRFRFEGPESLLPDWIGLVHSPANYPYWVEIVREKARLRALVSAAQGVVDRSFGAPDANEFIAESARVILDATKDDTIAGARHVKEFAQALTGEFEREHRGESIGIRTGIGRLDRMTGGLKPGDLVVFAGRPGAGKTAIALTITGNLLDTGLSVGFFSLEMTGVSLVKRMLAARARRNVKRITEWREGDFRSVTTALHQINSQKLFIDDTGGLRIDQIRAEARRLKDKHGIACLVIDYLQKVHASSPHSREREVAIVSDGLKCLAKELSIPVIALAQINRGAEGENRMPRMSDLRESGSIEQDADIVGLLWRPNAATEGDNEPTTSVDLYIAKQRDGEVGRVPMVFLKEFTRFEERSEIEE